VTLEVSLTAVSFGVGCTSCRADAAFVPNIIEAKDTRVDRRCVSSERWKSEGGTGGCCLIDRKSTVHVFFEVPISICDSPQTF
jgi:hypothetical protein